MSRVRLAAALVLPCLLLTACNIHKNVHSAGQAAPAGGAKAGGSSAGSPVAGPGPQSDYTFQQQPAPGSCHYGRTSSGEPLPDPSCTPGALNPKVTQATLKTTVCRQGGYTGSIRPPAGITDREKAANAKSYGYTGSKRDAEYDHLVSLELGGDPNDPKNLWVEPADPGHAPGSGPNNNKDKVESKLHTAVCTGKVTLSQAQTAIASDWTTAQAKLGLG